MPNIPTLKYFLYQRWNNYESEISLYTQLMIQPFNLGHFGLDPIKDNNRVKFQ